MKQLNRLIQHGVVLESGEGDNRRVRRAAALPCNTGDAIAIAFAVEMWADDGCLQVMIQRAVLVQNHVL